MTVRDFNICHLQGGTIRRRAGKKDEVSTLLINQAMLDLQNQLLTVKEFLFTVAARYAPIPHGDENDVEEFVSVS